MSKPMMFLLTAVPVLSLYIFLYADIIVTNDGMILNGKILEEKKDDYIKFGNYHGVFIIYYRQIKEIHRTERYEDDVKIFEEKGKSVNETEVKTNYQSGLEKLEEQKNAVEDTDKNIGEKTAEDAMKDTKDTIKDIRTADFVLLFSPFFDINTGRLRTILPYSFGGSAIADIPLDFHYIKKLFLTGVRTELSYFHSEKSAKRIIGPRASAGPLWQLPLSIGGFHFNYAISPVIGIGWYSVAGRTEKSAALKWNAAFITGPVFDISSAVLSPQLRFDYIYDKSVPLYGIGFSAGAGFRF